MKSQENEMEDSEVARQCGGLRKSQTARRSGRRGRKVVSSEADYTQKEWIHLLEGDG